MKRVAVLAFLLLAAGAAPAQTTVRVKDSAGNVVCELTIPAGGGVEVIHPGPGPGPAPNPGPVTPPNPTPVPPAPPAAKITTLVIIRDDTPGAMTGAQQALLRDPAVRDAVRRHGWTWEVYDVNSNAVQKPVAQGGLGLGGVLNNPNQPQAPNLRAPCVLFFGAKAANGLNPLLKGIPLPADSATFIAAIGG